MKISQEALEVIEDLIDSAGGEFQACSQYENEGICTECGHTQSGVEPDAMGYHCEECGESSVVGIETAIMMAR